MLERFEVNHEYDESMYRGSAVIDFIETKNNQIVVKERVRLKIPVYIKRESMIEYIEEHLKNADYLEDL